MNFRGVKSCGLALALLGASLFPALAQDRFEDGYLQSALSMENGLPRNFIDLAYRQGVMDTCETLTLASGGQMSGALTGTWTYDESSQYLTLAPASGPKVVVVVAREADWEASPRQATLVYAGTEKSLNATWWGKKVK